MKKQMFALACAVVIVAACQKEEETDFERGKKNGKAFCDCMTTGMLYAQCMAQLDLNKLMEAQISINAKKQIPDYAAGLITAPCVLEMLAEMPNGMADAAVDGDE
ncbi:MAG: hypothetical protein LBL94_07095 [Prevotellaceae bacterium]|jgi:hypothetical protein|nr:hypothetical protein [Prevotellaceae bacterium]